MLSRERDCRIISLCNYVENASVQSRLEEECGSQPSQTKSVHVNGQSRGGAGLLRVGSCDGRSRALATRVGNATLADEVTLDLALVLERLKAVVTGLLDVSGGLEIESTLNIVQSRQFNTGNS
jgi:hypothetical protein